MHREAEMIEQQAKQGKQDHNQQGGRNLYRFLFILYLLNNFLLLY